jgi:catechol 2,3-dioxygenase-like lactoylglutathione lyase family enzyme
MLRDSRAFSGYSVSDIPAAKTFYGDTLGLDVKEQPEGLAIQLNGGGMVFLYPKPNHQPATFTVLNFEVDRIDDAVAALKKRGVTFEQYDLPDIKTDSDGIARGGRPLVAWFKDPAGNILSVVQP